MIFSNFRKIILAVSVIPIGLHSSTAYAQPRTPYAPINWDYGSAGTYAGQENSHSSVNPTNPSSYQSPQSSTDYSNAYHNNGGLPGAAQGFAAAQGRFLQELNNAAIAAMPRQEHNERSALEDMYTRRVVDDINQFGYDLFGVPQAETRSTLMDAAQKSFSMPSGAVQDDFILDIGDQVEVVFTGQRADRGLYSINSQGMLLIPDFPPIPAAGRSMGQLRISIEAAARNLHNTNAYISLGSVRQIGVLVVGHVKRPGRRDVTVFHTVLDALMESGGVDKTGSLRQIKLIRDGRATLIDIYSLLLNGATNADLQLRDGDRIVVPSIGPTLAVTGEVKRPGIYEILPRIQGMRHQPEQTSERLSLNDVLELAGGVLVAGDNRFLKLSSMRDGKEQVSEITEAFEPTFGDGSILVVSKGQEKRAGMVELTGHTRKPGIHALHEASTLSDLLPNGTVLGDDIYPLIGVIERWNPEQLARTYLDFPLTLVMGGDYDRQLQEDDIIHLFSKSQIRALNQKTRERLPQGGHADGYVQAAFEPAAGSSGNDWNSDSDQGSRHESPLDADADANNKLTAIEDPALSHFLNERAAFLRGAVRNPGQYPIADGVTLDSILAVAGGLALEANTENIEVTSALNGEGHHANRRSGTRRMNINFRETNPKDVLIGPGDSVRVNQKFEKIHDKSVLIMGEVSNPGRYDLMPGDTVSDLITRAGGLRQDAYAQGAIFSRESERRAEAARFRAAANDLERSLAATIENDSAKGQTPNAGQIAMARGLADELRAAEAVGRITVEADPGRLAAAPELDMLLESGDRLFIPKRPMSVRVRGEVLSPAALQFREGKKPLDYIHEAGGFTFHADKDRAFVLYPDGSAQPLQVSSWNHRSSFIPPGSTIVIPRDPKPFDFIQSAKDISQIMSNLAITGIFLDDVRSE
jgi:polysaccharide biosynthesis/export protein